VREIEEMLRGGPKAAAERAAQEQAQARAADLPPFLPEVEGEPAEASKPKTPTRPILRLASPSDTAETPVPGSPADAEIEPPRDTAPSPGAPEPAAEAEAEKPAPETPSAGVWTEEIAAEKPFQGHPLFVVRADGALEIASPGVVYVRKGSVVWYSGNVRFTGEQAFRGTRLESILRADGRGYLFVSEPGRHAFRRDLAGQALSLEGSRLLALDHGLSFRLEPIHDFRMNRRVDILRIQGNGSVILSVTGPLLAHEVTAEFPLIVSAQDLVAWSGNLLPAVLEDRFLEEVMLPDSTSAPKLRFEGEGTVLTEPPRPRRRVTDRATSGAGDRRRP
jgi:uncharacterized protein (AIM24 family)